MIDKAIPLRLRVLFFFFRLLNNCHLFLIYREYKLLWFRHSSSEKKKKKDRTCFLFKKISLVFVTFLSLAFFFAFVKLCSCDKEKGKMTTTTLSRRMTCHVFCCFYLKIRRHIYFSLSFGSYFYSRIRVFQLYFFLMIEEDKMHSIPLIRQPMKIYRSATIQDSSNEENKRCQINDRATSTINMCTFER